MSGRRLLLEAHVADRVAGLAPGDAPVVVGVSGGIDSIVLLHALAVSGRSVIAAHVNYGLRGDESDGDEQLVRSSCERLDVPCRVLGVSDAPTASIQAWARRVRYDWFEQVAVETSAGAIAVAHHTDDQAETVLINIIRGTGLDGLRGMQPARPVRRASDIILIRPMLDVDRARIEQYAEERGLAWRTDASNESDRYLRTRVRTWLDGSTDLRDPARLADIARRASVTADVLAQSVELAGCPDPGSVRDGPLHLSDDLLRSLPPAVAGWMVNRALYGLDGSGPRNRLVVAEVLDLLSSQPGRRVESGDAIVWRMRDGLRFDPARRNEPDDAPVQQIRLGESVSLPGGRLTTERCEPPAPEDIRLGRHEAIIDADLLSDVLTVRPWRDGDRLQPLGMQGTRKVKDVLTDRRIPPPEKSDVYVVCSDERIVWIVGADTDHRYRVTSGTRTAARFKFLVC